IFVLGPLIKFYPFVLKRNVVVAQHQTDRLTQTGKIEIPELVSRHFRSQFNYSIYKNKYLHRGLINMRY
ncbi:GSCOCG00001782001-RA-CDS, partial [Cotesia congregata]